jgi:NAD+--asparagine ADP-ribosyltransferase
MATRLAYSLYFPPLIINFFIGETVTKDEQITLNETDETLSTTQSMMSLSTVASSSVVNSVVVANTIDNRPVTVDEWEKERSTLYQQLDEKVN